MRKHKHVTKCLMGDGPISKYCTCNHCTLCVCDVCGAYEGSLTTECPGERVGFARQEEVYKTDLDYTMADGWHNTGRTTSWNSPAFEDLPKFVDPSKPVEPPKPILTLPQALENLLEAAIAYAEARKERDRLGAA